MHRDQTCNMRSTENYTFSNLCTTFAVFLGLRNQTLPNFRNAIWDTFLFVSLKSRRFQTITGYSFLIFQLFKNYHSLVVSHKQTVIKQYNQKFSYILLFLLSFALLWYINYVTILNPFFRRHFFAKAIKWTPRQKCFEG